MTERFGKEEWRRFCRELEAAGNVVLDAALQPDDLEQAEGFRYLTRLLRVALEMNLENADPDFPSFYQASHATAKIGADNPDNHYLNATIAGDRTYRLRGVRGDAPILSFATKANRYAVDGTMASTGELDARDMTFGPDGDFEITVSQAPAAGDWLPLQPDSSMLLVRQTYFDKKNERRADVRIEAIDAPPRPAPLTAAALAAALSRSTAFVQGTAKTFLDWAESFRADNCNQLSTTDQSRFERAGGDPAIHYLHGWWALRENEALKITASIPPCEGWNFQLNNIWMESLDYRSRRIHVNNKTAHYNEDGSVTIVVVPCSADSLVGSQARNRIDAGDHRRGTMLWRWTGAARHPIPHTEVIRLDQ